MSEPLSPVTSAFLGLPSAVAEAEAEASPDAYLTAGHYGAPSREQRELAAGRAVVDLSGRGVITITGADRLTWLHNITSQSLLGLRAGSSAETILLSPTGRIEHVIRLFDDGQTAWLLVEAKQVESLVEFLNKMRFMMRVEVSDSTAEYATVGAFFGAAPAASGEAASSADFSSAAVRYVESFAEQANKLPVIWRDAWDSPPAGGWQYAPAGVARAEPDDAGGFGEEEDEHPSSRWHYVEAVVPRARIASLAHGLADAGLIASGWHALEALRVEAWRPRQALEVDDRAIPHEFDWMRTAVHLNKGCYRGQETVAKVHNLGHPPRRLAMLHLDGSESILPRHGDPVYLVTGDSRTQVGIVTTAARHYELGGIALALLKRSAPVDRELIVLAGLAENADGSAGNQTDIAAAQNVIVPPDAGSVADVPRLPRLGAPRAQ